MNFKLIKRFSSGQSLLTLLIFSTTLMISGCHVNRDDALIKIATEADLNNPKWQQHVQEVSALAESKYSANGNFAYLSKENRQSANFFWEQMNSQSYKLRLFNPLGQTVIAISVMEGRTEIVDDRGVTYDYTNPEEAILDLSMMDIPISQLRLWMLGLPGDASDVVLNEQLLLKSANYRANDDQSQWEVSFSKYNTSMIPSLPSELTITRIGTDENLKIKLKINNWLL